ncbi:hypothetical protein HDU67_009763, partial [Dinochytrium kinnereticum]
MAGSDRDVAEIFSLGAYRAAQHGARRPSAATSTFSSSASSVSASTPAHHGNQHGGYAPPASAPTFSPYGDLAADWQDPRIYNGQQGGAYPYAGQQGPVPRRKTPGIPEIGGPNPRAGPGGVAGINRGGGPLSPPHLHHHGAGGFPIAGPYGDRSGQGERERRERDKAGDRGWDSDRRDRSADPSSSVSYRSRQPDGSRGGAGDGHGGGGGGRAVDRRQDWESRDREWDRSRDPSGSRRDWGGAEDGRGGAPKPRPHRGGPGPVSGGGASGYASDGRGAGYVSDGRSAGYASEGKADERQSRSRRRDQDYSGPQQPTSQDNGRYEEDNHYHSQQSQYPNRDKPSREPTDGSREPRRQIYRRQQQPLPYHDPHFEECVEDFLILFDETEVAAEPFLRDYVAEMLARWGRWTARGRAPHLCFEAAALGGMRVLEDGGWKPSERTERIERALAEAMAGLTVDALEPDAAPVMRAKAVMLLADEFLARAASPKLATPAKKRAKKRRSRYPVMGVEGDEWDIDMKIAEGVEEEERMRAENEMSDRKPSLGKVHAQSGWGQDGPNRRHHPGGAGTPPPPAPPQYETDDYMGPEVRIDRRVDRRKGSVGVRPGGRGMDEPQDHRYQHHGHSPQPPNPPPSSSSSNPSSSSTQSPYQQRRRRPPPPQQQQDMHYTDGDNDADDVSHVSLRSDSLRGGSPQPTTVIKNRPPPTSSAYTPPSQRSASVSASSTRRRGSHDPPLLQPTNYSPSTSRRVSQDNMPPSPSYAPEIYERRPSVEAISSTAYSALLYDRRPSLDAMAGHQQFRRPSLDAVGDEGYQQQQQQQQQQHPSVASSNSGWKFGGVELERRPSLDPSLLRSGSLSSKYGGTPRGGQQRIGQGMEGSGGGGGGGSRNEIRRPSVESVESSTSSHVSSASQSKWPDRDRQPSYRVNAIPTSSTPPPQTRTALPISVDPRFEAVESDSDSEDPTHPFLKAPPPHGPSRLGAAAVSPVGESVRPAFRGDATSATSIASLSTSSLSSGSVVGYLGSSTVTALSPPGEEEYEMRRQPVSGPSLPNPPMPRTSSRRERPPNHG